MEKKLGSYSFIVGVIVAIVLGVASPQLGVQAVTWLTSLLIVAGLVIGFLNVTGKETKEFLMVSVALVIVAFAGKDLVSLENVEIIGNYLQGIFQSVLAIVIPATIVVALKDIWELAKEGQGL
ncbi:hypothetical protein HYU10_00195 [Candidatus Woesearchaeota archaeon]|nr:hypothetical protein [Candidatus Woesearchaeota archaeon]MBI2130170.1 hypothetical protein [Candidatus Woesearchaeota archaeon]MBI2661052.1 hypothetical protein [Candidatus Woesearchaeota archaeon]